VPSHATVVGDVSLYVDTTEHPLSAVSHATAVRDVSYVDTTELLVSSVWVDQSMQHLVCSARIHLVTPHLNSPCPNLLLLLLSDSVAFAVRDLESRVER
jgi:hypothetical protein